MHAHVARGAERLFPIARHQEALTVRPDGRQIEPKGQTPQKDDQGFCWTYKYVHGGAPQVLPRSFDPGSHVRAWALAVLCRRGGAAAWESWTTPATRPLGCLGILESFKEEWPSGNHGL